MNTLDIKQQSLFAKTVSLLVLKTQVIQNHSSKLRDNNHILSNNSPTNFHLIFITVPVAIIGTRTTEGKFTCLSDLLLSERDSIAYLCFYGLLAMWLEYWVLEQKVLSSVLHRIMEIVPLDKGVSILTQLGGKYVTGCRPGQ